MDIIIDGPSKYRNSSQSGIEGSIRRHVHGLNTRSPFRVLLLFMRQYKKKKKSSRVVEIPELVT